jgi:hypothetical protein
MPELHGESGTRPELRPSEASRRPRQLHRRVDVLLPVRISTIDPETDPNTGKPYYQISEERCLNLSRGGLFVKTPESVAPGHRIMLEVDFPNGTSLQTIGQVVWRRTELGGGLGVRFVPGQLSRFPELERFLDNAPAPRKRPSIVRVENPLLG